MQAPRGAHPYRGYNAFGDTVQGPMYYMPFKGTFGSDAEMAIEVGGVCGSLSHVGAAAAIASGIPAMTMGEPATAPTPCRRSRTHGSRHTR